MAAQPSILVVDDMPRNVQILRDRLKSEGYRVSEAGNGVEALRKIRQESPDVVLLDILMPEMDGYQVLEIMKADAALRTIPVIVVSAVDQIESVARCLELGAEDHLCKPFDPVILKARLGACLQRKQWRDQEKSYLRQIEREVREREQAQRDLSVANEELERRVAARTAELRSALEEVEKLRNRLQAENTYLQQEIKGTHDFDAIVGRSPGLKGVLASIEQVARTDATVLILGETGTGKELLARALHSISGRQSRPLVKVDCTALPANLIESELFGHEKGAFTGAVARRVGRFELADGGTVFLDEVGELPLELQAKLLRVLQDGELERLGSATTIKVNVRVIAATNRDLEAAIASGGFREDLFYRLNVFPIRCPPLRERRDDMPLLIEHFVAKHGARIGKKVQEVALEVIEALRAYDWPGNIRELENVVERAVIVSPGNRLELGDWLPRPASVPAASTVATMDQNEREHITRVLQSTGWKIRGSDGAASILGMKPTTLEARMKKLGIERPRPALGTSAGTGSLPQR